MDDAVSHSFHRPGTLPAIALSALIGAAAAMVLVPRWLPPSVEFFEARDGNLRFRAPDAAQAMAAARRGQAGRLSAVEETREARRASSARLAASIPDGPLPALSPVSECVAWLRGWSIALRLAGSTGTPRSTSTTAMALPSDLARLRDAIDRGARGTDLEALSETFELEQGAWRRWLESEARALPPARRAELWGEWRAGIETRARELEELATLLEIGVTPFQRQIIPAHARLRALALEPRLPDPSTVLAAVPASTPGLTVRPLPSAWVPLGVAGALAGSLLACLVALLSGAFARGSIPAGTRLRTTGEARAWLQLVTASNRRAVARAVCELSACALARGERVVIVDLAPGLRLHEPLGLSPRLGWSDCARRNLPALGLVQNGGFTGLFLLGYGSGGPVRNWLALDRVLEELRPYFGRAVIAIDHRVPFMLGGLLAGRVVDGWWAGPGPSRGRVPERAADLLAISLRDMDLGGVPKASLEALEARLAALGDLRDPGLVRAATAPEPERAPGEEPRISSPAVLDCDLQLRQRLRFLAWMRRVQTERRSRESEAAPLS